MDANVTSSDESFNNFTVNDGLVGYWKLDDTASPAIDSSGYENSGTWVDATTTTISVSSTIKFNNPRAISLDGGGDYINIGDQADHSFGDGSNDQAFTISAWYNPDVVAQTQDL